MLRLDDERALDPRVAGGKGAGLARLSRAGFPVPPAVILPPRAAELVASGEPVAIEALMTALGASGIATGPLAVRSSALDEDAEAASFAGQYETVLGVQIEDGAIRAAVARCLASAQSEGVAAYRAQTEGTEIEGAMAVVVQRQLSPEVAGVAFTVDPATGEDVVVVEAVAGLADRLVAGEVRGDRAVLRKGTWEILELTFTGAPVLASETAVEIAKAAEAVEAALGGPQDVEFAVAEGTVWMLQARPVTVPATGGGWRSEFDTETDATELWTSANVQEVLPGLLTPLSMTLFQELADHAYGEGYRRLKLLRKDERPKFVGLFYNRAFLNVGATRLIAERAMGSSGDAVEHRFLGGEYREKPARGQSLELWWFRARSLPPVLMALARMGGAVNRLERQTLSLERKLRAKDLSTIPDERFDALRKRVAYFGADVFRVHLQVSGMAALGFDTVAREVRRVLGDEAEGQVPALFSGVTGVESAEIGIDTWELSRVAIATAVSGRLEEPGFEPLDQGLPLAWTETYTAFMEKHGHHGLNEMEASARPWRIDPAPVLGILRAYSGVAESESPEAVLQRQTEARLALTEEVVGALPRFRRPGFRLQLGLAQRWVSQRERTKSVVVRATRTIDFIAPEVQRRLARKGVIREPDDLYFLTSGEVSDGLADRAEPGAHTARILRRRRERERNRQVRLPERFHGHPAPLMEDASHHEGETLRGTPVSPGVVTGRARVIIDPGEDGPMQAGEILVAPVTDAGWTPLFALATGLVVDMGSALSHGSTVAREYGLPAVVNVHDGTRRIRTGDLVQVDGTRGEVRILGEPEG